ncbi:galactonate dehydratase [Capronia epimyces CBS 606.96]|uniref:Galactonate dehydratase n=1 Tax=Capronia epimyces CBS 606.96 TaxID=1182542 RepID=W9Y0M8_9EURO|nr:galactonate dehydratase [Capronia epimyces CBS 606.96]EXJ82796.1 galactonate dehydratase [Capronia epimyces CBS 606.96]
MSAAPAKTHLIASVEPIHAGQFMFVRIRTDTGIVGYGEAGIWGHISAAATVIQRFGEYLVGKAAFDIEHHWNVMHRFSYFQGLLINAGISAIDIALWDIKGKALGVPIYELLGGRCRSKARVYGHILGGDIETIVDECRRKMAQGFNALGHINPFLDESHDAVYFKPHVRKMDEAVANVRRLREAVGDQVDLLIEVHRRLTPAEAVTFANAIADTRPLFVEDPIRPESAEAMARVAARIAVPIATGERLGSLYEFEALFRRDAVEFARVDVALCGGITGAKKVAALAEAHNVQLVPHNPLSPVGLAACLQIAAAVPNFAIQEYTTGFEALAATSTVKHLGSDLVDHVPVPKDGFVDIPTGPGLGVNLLDNAQSIRPPLVLPITMRPHYDGFVVDQ